MRKVKQISIVFATLILARIVFSCCDCNEPQVPFDFDCINIENLDNTGAWATSNATDTMKRQAVAFEVTIGTSDSMIYYTEYISRQKFGFPASFAFECNCIIPYKPNQTITGIRITTIYPINSSLLANSELSEENILYAQYNYYTDAILYITKEKLLEQINPSTIDDTPSIAFQFFLKDKVENDVAQFTIDIELSDGRILSAQTNIITII